MALQDFVEEIQVLGRDLVDKVKSLIHEGNVQRVIIKDDHGHTFVEIPVTFAALGVIAAPVLAAVSAIAAAVAKFTVVVERTGAQNATGFRKALTAELLSSMLDEFECGLCKLRRFVTSDRGSLVKYANNHKIWLNVRDRFPHPYTPADADSFLASLGQPGGTESVYAIDVEGEAVGGIGVHGRLNEERHVAEIGYWLGEPFWGRGIVSAAVQSVSHHALNNGELYRLFANVFASNGPSMRVLEKAGFQREGVLRRSVIKDGLLMDTVVFGLTRDPGLPYVPAQL